MAARQAYLEGSKHYDLSQYEEALEAFKRAYWNYEDPVILFNIAQCHRALGHKSEALAFYKSYLRKSVSAPNRDEVQRLIAELDASIAQQKAREATTQTQHQRVEVAAPVSTSSAGSGPTAAPERRRIRPWVWVVVGGTVAVAAGLGLGLGFGLSRDRDPNPSFGATVLQ